MWSDPSLGAHLCYRCTQLGIEERNAALKTTFENYARELHALQAAFERAELELCVISRCPAIHTRTAAASSRQAAHRRPPDLPSRLPPTTLVRPCEAPRHSQLLSSGGEQGQGGRAGLPYVAGRAAGVCGQGAANQRARRNLQAHADQDAAGAAASKQCAAHAALCWLMRRAGKRASMGLLSPTTPTNASVPSPLEPATPLASAPGSRGAALSAIHWAQRGACGRPCAIRRQSRHPRTPRGACPPPTPRRRCACTHRRPRVTPRSSSRPCRCASRRWCERLLFAWNILPNGCQARGTPLARPGVELSWDA